MERGTPIGQGEAKVNNRFFAIAGTLAAAAIAALLTNNYNGVAVTAALAGSAIFGLLGIEKLRTLINIGVVTPAIRSEYFYLGLLAVTWLYVVATAYLLQYKRIVPLENEMIILRDDLDRYAMPRRLTEKQTSVLVEYLSKHKPQTVELRVVKNDQEAAAYSQDIRIAIEKAGWPVSHAPPLPEAQEGLALHYSYTIETGSRPDNMKPPKPHAVLHEALRTAGQMVTSSGGGSQVNATVDYVSLTIGRRRRDSYTREGF